MRYLRKDEQLVWVCSQWVFFIRQHFQQRWTTCLATCWISPSEKSDNLPRHMLDESPWWDISLSRSQRTYLSKWLMSLLDEIPLLREVRQLAWVSVWCSPRWDTTLEWSQTTCLGKCTMSLPSETLLSAEVRKLTWVGTWWVSQMRHNSQEKSDNLPIMCLMTTLVEIRQLA